ncbi:MAG: site-2 protease family protein [Anaerolineae bacterium]|jgi:membrane-associated protease RseP (regulator of RpoE activity)
MFDDVKEPAQRAAEQVEEAVSDLFAVDDVTLGIPGGAEAMHRRAVPRARSALDRPGRSSDGVRLRGRLQVPSEQAYPKIAARLRKMGYTAVLRRDPENDLDVLLAVPGVMPQESRPRLWLNALLFALTILATLFVGAFWSDQVPSDADLGWILTHLWIGWPFALSLMTILTGHELGHYFAGRYYKVPVSLPYFIPMPVPPLGTMGAFILMKGQSVNRRQMLTVGAAGPLVGFILAVPVLILGLSLSTVEPMAAPESGMMVFLEGNSLLYLLLKFVLFGQILPGSGAPPTILAAWREVGAALLGTFPIDSGYDVFIHPVALAGWAGLLVTAFNLLPVGQLDGGHVLYSLVGQRAKALTWPVVGVLVVMGLFLWQGWLLWAALIFLFGRAHPDPLDDVTRLDTPRKIVAVAVLLIFVVTFTPLPMRVLTGDLPVLEPGRSAAWLGVPGLLVGMGVWFARRWRVGIRGVSVRKTERE